MIEIRLHGPFVLLPHADIATLYSKAEAHKPGLFLWAFDHNRAHRINFVSVAEQSIVKNNLDLLSRCITGERAIYNTERLDEGELESVADASSSLREKCAASGAAFSHLSRVRVFYAETTGKKNTDEMIATGIIRKLLDFGDKPAAWLDPSLRSLKSDSTTSEKQEVTGRFHRPAFIASLPDEMYL